MLTDAMAKKKIQNPASGICNDITNFKLPGKSFIYLMYYNVITLQYM